MHKIPGGCPVFFFQAEDGIRDLTVTGVQTCALPISVTLATAADARTFRNALTAVRANILRPQFQQVLAFRFSHSISTEARGCRGLGLTKIGRASCRERV